MNLLEPWVLLRLVASVVTFLLFCRGALTAAKILRYFDIRSSNEGQLALERQLELSAALARVGASTQGLSLLLTVLAADRLSRGVRGAMCAFGVFSANRWGFWSLVTTAVVALFAALAAQLYAFDARLRSLELARPLAIASLVLVPLGAADLAGSWAFLGTVDLTAVSSCCSVQLDPVATAAGSTLFVVPRVPLAAVTVVWVLTTIAVALRASAAPTRSRVAWAGAFSLAALPLAMATSIFEVAPHAFEMPHHICPFCLLRADVWAMGYPLFGAMFCGCTWIGGAGLAAVIARRTDPEFSSFARGRLRRGAAAWGIAMVVGLAPIVRFSFLSGGASLFASP